jgi:tRNA pseudouridine13 synthase
LSVPRLEKKLGIEVYATKSCGIGGRIRRFPEDFVVEEILLDESKATVEPKNVSSLTGRGRYLVCILVKRNWDTLLAVRTIAQQLSMSQERLHIAGIKDANALTAQHISISRTMPEQISSVKIKNIWLYPLRFSNEKIHSKTLLGNQFRILVREITHSSAKIEQRIENVQNELENAGGVPNFFGHQRFGTKRAITHLVGKQIVKGEWEKAALTFLAKPSEFEHPESKQARQQLWETQDFVEAFNNFPFQLRQERMMLSHLAKHPRDFVGAFRRLPTKLCQLFVQAYQSYLFNKFVSRRIKRGISLNQTQKGDYMVKVDNQSCLALPIVGFKQTLSSGAQGQIEREILEEENFTPEHFRISIMPQISAAGGLRTALMPIKDLFSTKPSTDSVNPSKRKIEFSFMLGKGSYATVVLREFMKPRNPVTAGF